MVDDNQRTRVLEALADIDEWPVDNAAAAVIAPPGADEAPEVLAAHGDTGAVFELASVTKLLTAGAALMAIEEGAIGLDDASGPEGATVRHLLAHASGVAFDSAEVKAEPGTKRIYSSAGYEILADHIAGSTGIDFPAYLAEGLCGALGMTSTELHGSAGHGARSTVDDLSALAAEMLAPKVLSPQTWTEACEVAWPEINGLVPGYGMFKPCPWGLGPEIKGDKGSHWTGTQNSARTFGHFGQSGTLLWVDPEAGYGGVALVVLTDRAFGDWAKPLWTSLADAVIEATG